MVGTVQVEEYKNALQEVFSGLYLEQYATDLERKKMYKALGSRVSWVNIIYGEILIALMKSSNLDCDKVSIFIKSYVYKFTVEHQNKRFLITDPLCQIRTWHEQIEDDLLLKIQQKCTTLNKPVYELTMLCAFLIVGMKIPKEVMLQILNC